MSGDARPEQREQPKRAVHPLQSKHSPQSEYSSQPEHPSSLLRSSLIKRIRAWWHRAPLAATFSVYLIAYLTVATLLAAWLINVVFSDENETQFVVALTGDEKLQAAQRLYSGPYIYDEAANELVPASEFPITGSDALGVFVGKVSWAPEVTVNHRGECPVYATRDDVAGGTISLYDWGLNFPTDSLRKDVLEYGERIAADDLAFYDARMRTVRVDVREELSGALSTDLLVSNVAYYASTGPSQPPLLRIIYLIEGMTPFVVYSCLGWVVFRRFYRVHIACPLDEMGEAARRIAAQDLDFEVSPVRGRELGRLARALEDMRASLLEANRELWRVAEDRRRLNAAFAHDLRTPVTVLKGTVELARMRAARDGEVGERQLASLGEQVDRLASYAQAMGGLTKLDDRVLACEPRTLDVVTSGLERYAHEVMRAYGPKMALEVECGGCDAMAGMTVMIDCRLIEEVLENLLKNACAHAVSRVAVCLEAAVQEPQNGCVCESGTRAAVLSVCVADDGPGFSSEALIRGMDPFYSEAKSAEHFGLGLSIAQTLTRLHGGDVELANDSQGGARVLATFTCSVDDGSVTLPSGA